MWKYVCLFVGSSFTAKRNEEFEKIKTEIEIFYLLLNPHFLKINVWNLYGAFHKLLT